YRLKGRPEATLRGVGFITVAAAYDWNRIFERATSDSQETTDCCEGTYKKKEALDRPCRTALNQRRNQERNSIRFTSQVACGRTIMEEVKKVIDINSTTTILEK
ncbi:unnamed protein product, partial [Musa hybrid cultivar]